MQPTVLMTFSALNYLEPAPPVRWRLFGHSWCDIERSVQKMPHRPSLVSHPESLSWRGPQGLMNAAEIVMRDVQRHGSTMMIELL